MEEATGHTDPFGLVGTILERKYRVDRVVAEGGFGIVYAGYHLALDLPVAIKVLNRRAEFGNEAWQDLVARFVQEAQTMAKLRHPNIVTALDTGVAQTAHGLLPWLVMEWLEGTTLKDDLFARRGHGGRTLREALDLMRPIVQAVAEAHHARVAHRDIKPSNVMLVPGRRGVTPRVVDFGVSKIMQDEARASSAHTTTDDAVRAFSLGYAAPEQIAGARTGPWTDVHALGLLLTEVLVDAAPYSDDPTEQHARAFDTARPTPAKFGVDAGPLEVVIARAIALRPASRFVDAGALLAAIEEAAPECVSAAPVVRDDPTGSAMTSESRRPGNALVAWAVVAAAAIVVATAGAAMRAGGDRAGAPVGEAPVPLAPTDGSPGTPALGAASIAPLEPTAATAPSLSLPPPTTARPRAAPPSERSAARRPPVPPAPGPAVRDAPLSSVGVTSPLASTAPVFATPPATSSSGRPRYVPE